jgi:hypothetical protein
MKESELLRANFEHFTKVYADYVALRDYFEQVRREVWMRERLIKELNKIIDEHKATYEQFARQMRA